MIKSNITYDEQNIIELIEYISIEDDWFDINQRIDELYIKFNNEWYKLNKKDVKHFIYWLLNIKLIIKNAFNYNKNIFNFRDTFWYSGILKFNASDYWYIAEGNYSIIFQYNWLFAVKIPKIDIFYNTNINNLQNESHYFENAYWIFIENDIKEDAVSNNIIDRYNDFNYIKENIVVLPDFIDQNLLFWIYPLWNEISLDNNNKIITNWKNIKNIDLFNYLININITDQYNNLLDWLDFKLEHILLIWDTLKYCDVDENVIICFLEIIKELNINY